MSIIPCSQNCIHQSDGYCSLNEISALTGDCGGAKCGYFERRTAIPGESPLLLHHPKGISQAAHPNQF